jgi:hypothetical protein
MANAYRALSNIEHGEEKTDKDGNVTNVVKKFEYGQLVTGLDKDIMKNLWDAGVLEQVDVPEAPKPESKQTEPSGGAPAAPAAGSSTTSGTAAATGSGS